MSKNAKSASVKTKSSKAAKAKKAQKASPARAEIHAKRKIGVKTAAPEGRTIIPIVPSKTHSRAENEACHFAQQIGATEDTKPKTKSARKRAAAYPFAPPKTPAGGTKEVVVPKSKEVLEVPPGCGEKPKGEGIAANVA